MNRPLRFFLAVTAGLLLIVLGFAVPAHFRTVDARVIAAAPAAGPSLTDAAAALAGQGKLGPARLLLLAAQRSQAPGTDRVQADLAARAKARPELLVLGGPDAFLEPLLQPLGNRPTGRPVLELLLPPDTRRAAFDALGRSADRLVARLLATRELTNTVHFPPANSASGQALEAAIVVTALLVQGGHLAEPLHAHVEHLAREARWGQLEKLELVYLDFLSLAKRLDWAQLTELTRRVEDAAALQQLAGVMAGREDDLPLVFAATFLTGRAAGVADHFVRHGGTAAADVGFALRHGAGGVRELLARQRPIRHPKRDWLAAAGWPEGSAVLARITLGTPWLGLALKLMLFFDGAYLLALAGIYLLPEDGSARRLVSAPQVAFTAIFLGLIVLFSEPFLSEANPKNEFPIYWKFPMIGGPVRAAIQNTVNPMVDTLSLVSLSVFLVIQVILYIVCRRKLGEIQRQSLPGKLKLKLLENEEHLFDAGLYVGFVGTVLSLVCVTIGIIKPSLMAAYSSTSFGIIFVSILKICHVRPYRRQLIIETETRPE